VDTNGRKVKDEIKTKSDIRKDREKRANLKEKNLPKAVRRLKEGKVLSLSPPPSLSLFLFLSFSLSSPLFLWISLSRARANSLSLFISQKRKLRVCSHKKSELLQICKALLWKYRALLWMCRGQALSRSFLLSLALSCSLSLFLALSPFLSLKSSTYF